MYILNTKMLLLLLLSMNVKTVKHIIMCLGCQIIVDTGWSKLKCSHGVVEYAVEPFD